MFLAVSHRTGASVCVPRGWGPAQLLSARYREDRNSTEAAERKLERLLALCEQEGVHTGPVRASLIASVLSNCFLILAILKFLCVIHSKCMCKCKCILCLIRSRCICIYVYVLTGPYACPASEVRRDRFADGES